MKSVAIKDEGLYMVTANAHLKAARRKTIARMTLENSDGVVYALTQSERTYETYLGLRGMLNLKKGEMYTFKLKGFQRAAKVESFSFVKIS